MNLARGLWIAIPTYYSWGGGGDGPQNVILIEMFYYGIFEGRKICVQLNLSTTATLRTEESGRCREV